MLSLRVVGLGLRKNFRYLVALITRIQSAHSVIRASNWQGSGARAKVPFSPTSLLFSRLVLHSRAVYIFKDKRIFISRPCQRWQGLKLIACWEFWVSKVITSINRGRLISLYSSLINLMSRPLFAAVCFSNRAPAPLCTNSIPTETLVAQFSFFPLKLGQGAGEKP